MKFFSDPIGSGINERKHTHTLTYSSFLRVNSGIESGRIEFIIFLIIYISKIFNNLHLYIFKYIFYLNIIFVYIVYIFTIDNLVNLSSYFINN